MSDTPRTDSRAFDAEDVDDIVYASVARVFERELNAAKAEIDRLREELESHSFDLSPAMVQARNDQLNEQLDEARKALTMIAGPNAVLPDDGRTTCRIYEDIANAALKSMEGG